MKTGKRMSRKCPLCKTTATSEMSSLSSYWFCKVCLLGWLKILPQASYQDDYYTPKFSLLSKLFIPISNIFFSIREHYIRCTNKELWIDVGAGDGSFLQSVHAKKKIGVETSKAGIRIMKSKNLPVLTDKKFLETENLNAQVISFWHVLEHVENPWEYLKAAKKNLNKNGKIVIGIPNNQSYELSIFKNYWFHLAPEFHVWHFSPLALTKVLGQTGFMIEKIDFWSIEHHLTGLLQSFINSNTQSKDLLHHMTKRTNTNLSINKQDVLWIIFWCTFGFPIVVFFWIRNSVIHASGTFVVVASRKS